MQDIVMVCHLLPGKSMAYLVVPKHTYTTLGGIRNVDANRRPLSL